MEVDVTVAHGRRMSRGGTMDDGGPALDMTQLDIPLALHVEALLPDGLHCAFLDASSVHLTLELAPECVEAIDDVFSDTVTQRVSPSFGA